MSAGVVARFVSFRSVPARGVMSFTMDVEAKDAALAIERLGMPIVGQSLHVALCPLATADAPPRTDSVTNATYEGCRMVSGRGALALTLEVPTERGHMVLKALGVPTPGQQLWVAIVPLVGAVTEPPPVRPKDPAVVAVQQAAMRPKDEAWQRWILASAFVDGDPRGNEIAAIEAMRTQLDIVSRSELRTNPEKLAEWHAMVRRFEVHIQGGAVPAGE